MKKEQRRLRRKKSIRKKISGSMEKPRMIINDIENKTLCSASTLSPKVREKLSAATRKNIKAGEVLGEEIARLAAEKNITKVVFDRSGYTYHGVVKALADSARKGGLKF